MRDDGYVPFISRIHWSWTVFLTPFTAGVLPLLLVLYISLWVYQRRRSGIAVYVYGIITLLMLLVSLVSIRLPHFGWVDDTFTILIISWLASGLILRRELRLLYGKEFEINPLWTALFSVYYLNYCLWAIG
jgi:hypothetical protein